MFHLSSKIHSMHTKMEMHKHVASSNPPDCAAVLQHLLCSCSDTILGETDVHECNDTYSM